MEGHAPSWPNRTRRSAPLQTPVLGVDPGSLTTGYAFIEENGRRLIVRDFGQISPPAKAPLPRRLLAIHDALDSKILAHRPTCLSLEALFVAKGLQSMMKLVYAKGVVLLLAARHNLDVFEYPALTVKKSVVGYGQAEKRQVQFMVRQLLGLKDLPRPDEADAMALALCHIQARKARLLTGAAPGRLAVPGAPRMATPGPDRSSFRRPRSRAEGAAEGAAS